MTIKDLKLLKKAYETKAVDNQLVERMIHQTDTDECKEALKKRYHYLYAKEEELAGLI